MKKILAAVLVSGLASSFASAATPGEAGELGLHKLERLVTLKKIDASFETQAISLSASAAAIGFNVMIMEGAATDGTARMLSMTTDKDGKILTYSEMAAKAPESPIALPGKSAVNLLELGMHCIQGEVINGSKACGDFVDGKMYNEHFKAANLVVSKDAMGMVIGAEVSISGEGLTKVMVVTLSNDGSLVSIAEK